MKSIRNERKVRKREIEHKKKIVAAQVRPCVERGGEREKHKTENEKKNKKKKRKKKDQERTRTESQEEASEPEGGRVKGS